MNDHDIKSYGYKILVVLTESCAGKFYLEVVRLTELPKIKE